MRPLTNIFEGIFSQGEGDVLDHGIILNPDSAFNKEWALQVRPENLRLFDIKDRLLHIGGENIKRTTLVFIDCEKPLTNYLSSVEGIYTGGVLQISGKKLDPTMLGSVISAYQYISLQNISKINSIHFKGKSNTTLSLDNCGILDDCTLDNITDFSCLNPSQINVFKKCNAPDLIYIFMQGHDLFKNGWSEFEKLVDWDQLIPPTNLRTDQLVSLNPKSLSKIASILKYSTRYSWGRKIEIPMVVQYGEIIKHLFPGCKFPSLTDIRISDNNVILDIRPDNNLVKMYKK